MKNLIELYRYHNGKVSDKWSYNINYYNQIFNEFENMPIKLLEIGIQNGGSLEIWAKYFENAKAIVGCDINEKCGELKFDDKRIKIVLGDANKIETLGEIKALNKDYDIIIDDGSHKSSDIIQAFSHYFPLLNEGGLYIVEDLHCSYWQEYEGGIEHPSSSLSFFRRLTDYINREYWGDNGNSNDRLEHFTAKFGINIDEEILLSIELMTFLDSVVVLRKKIKNRNVENVRLICGHSAYVCKEVLDLKEKKSQSPDQFSSQFGPTSACRENILLQNFELNNFKSREAGLKEELLFFQAQLADTTSKLIKSNTKYQEAQTMIVNMLHELIETRDKITLIEKRYGAVTELMNDNINTTRKKYNSILKLRNFRRSNFSKACSLLLHSGIFDEVWYRREYPEIEGSSFSPVAHYLLFGAFEGKNPGPKFDSSFYLENNPDVMYSGINPLLHFLQNGIREGRLPRNL